VLTAINARDWPRLQACYTQDVQLVDHRPEAIPAHPAHMLRSLLDSMPDARAAIQFLDAGLGQAMSRLHLYGHDRAGTEAETVIGQVLALREGRIARVELFEPDDEAGMRSRLERLEPDADWGPATRCVQRYVDCLNSRDIERIRGYYTEDFRLVDHRLASPWSGGLSGGEHVAAYQAMFDSASDALMSVEHIGELDGVWLGKLTWIGHQNETDGEFEIPFRAVMIWNDRCSQWEVFGLEDERGALQAMTRLLAPPTVGAAPVATDLVLGLADAVVNRDWDRVKGCFAPDLETVDHRRIKTLGLDRPGGEGFVERVRGLLALAADAQPIVEPLAELDGIAMAVVVWSGHLNEGGGPFELRWRGVFVAHDGVIVRYEMFDENDEAGMLAALARLRGNLNNPSAVLFRRHCAGFNARDWAATAAVYAEDCVAVDRRPGTGWPVLRGTTEIAIWQRHWLTMSPDLQESFEILEGDDECAIARYAYHGHATEADGGGELNFAALNVAVARGGLAGYLEFYEPDADIEMVRARREELRPLARRRPGTGLPDEPLPVEHATLRFTEAIDSGDWTAVTTMLDPQLPVLDHRGGAPCDRDTFVTRLQALPGGATRYTVFAASDALIAGVLTTGGHRVGAVMDWQADTCTRIELFDAADETGMLAALRRLQDDAPASAAGTENP